MLEKRLETEGFDLSPIGFGCWAIGGTAGYKPDDKESIKAIRKAYELGTNYFDTSNIYGFGHSEHILSKALGRNIDSIIISTKFGLHHNEYKYTFKDCSPKAIIESLHGSLRRLNIESIPIYILHWHDGKTRYEDIANTLLKAKSDGKIETIGCSNITYSEVEELNKYCEVSVFQQLYNPAQKSIASVPNQIDIISFGTIAQGLLAGGTPKLYKAGLGHYSEALYSKYLVAAETIKRIAIKKHKTPAQICIAWALTNKNISSVLVGMHTEKQVIENSKASVRFLTEKEIEEISNATKGS